MSSLDSDAAMPSVSRRLPTVLATPYSSETTTGGAQPLMALSGDQRTAVGAAAQPTNGPGSTVAGALSPRSSSQPSESSEVGNDQESSFVHAGSDQETSSDSLSEIPGSPTAAGFTPLAADSGSLSHQSSSPKPWVVHDNGSVVRGSAADGAVRKTWGGHARYVDQGLDQGLASTEQAGKTILRSTEQSKAVFHRELEQARSAKAIQGRKGLQKARAAMRKGAKHQVKAENALLGLEKIGALPPNRSGHRGHPQVRRGERDASVHLCAFHMCSPLFRTPFFPRRPSTHALLLAIALVGP